MESLQLCFFEENKKTKKEKRMVNFEQKRLIMQINKNKITRKKLTDTIMQFVEYAKKQGSSRSKAYYLAFSKLAKSFIDDEIERQPNEFDRLKKLSLIEDLISTEILNNIQKKEEYHNVYNKVKYAVELVSRYI